MTPSESSIDALLSSFLGSDFAANVYIQDPNNARMKLKKLLSGGSQCLRIVSDFDRTMSKFRHNNQLVPICHDIFGIKSSIQENAKIMLKALYDKYSPIEHDRTIHASEKISYMLEWWRSANEVIASCGVQREELAAMVRKCGIILRTGTEDFIRLLQNHQIPILIFSAGLGDVIQLLLEYADIDTKNITVISNFMRFNDAGVIVGFHDPIIHSFNKTAASITNYEYADSLSQRPCVLLLGDSIGDVHMADSDMTDGRTAPMSTVFRIGFLNDHVEDNLEIFGQLYDLVIVDDETFSIPLKIVQAILQPNSTCPT